MPFYPQHRPPGVSSGAQSLRLKDLLFLNPALGSLRTRIGAGPNSGRVWSLTTSRKYLSGTFERARVQIIHQLIRPGQCVWDVGAHYGYISLIAAAQAHPGGTVYAFEPNPRNRWFLRKHLQWNGARAEVFPYALSGASGREAFVLRGSGTSSLEGSDGHDTLIVEVTCIDRLVDEGRCQPPHVLKLDVEGSEVGVLRGGAQTLKRHSAIVLAATHSRSLHCETLGTLRDLGYATYEPHRLEGALTNGWNSQPIEPEILALGPGVALPSDVIEAFTRS